MVNRVMLMQFADPYKSCFTLFHHPISSSCSSCALSISFIDMILDDPPTEDAELHSGDTNPMLQHPFTTLRRLGEKIGLAATVQEEIIKKRRINDNWGESNKKKCPVKNVNNVNYCLYSFIRYIK